MNDIEFYSFLSAILNLSEESNLKSLLLEFKGQLRGEESRFEVLDLLLGGDRALYARLKRYGYDKNSEYLFFRDTLYICNADTEELIIPHIISGERIRRIAGGCVISKSVQELVIEEGIEYIGANAFLGAFKLRKVILPDSLCRAGDERLFNDNIRINDNFHVYVSRRLDPDDFAALIGRSVRLKEGYLLINKNDPDLRLGEGFGMGSICELTDAWMKELTILGNHGKQRRFEFMPVPGHMKAPSYKEAEGGDDASFGLGRNDKQAPVFMFPYFDPDSAALRDGKYCLSVSIRFGRAHFPYTEGLRLGNDIYYAHTMAFLFSKDSFIKDPSSICFTDDFGNAVDDELSRRLLAKYRLLSVIA